MATAESAISSADVFDAIVNKAPGPLDIPIMRALVGPPTNVRVEATSNSSAVVQWDFENGQVDGFVVKYMHEPGGRSDTERWTARTVMSPTSRHLEVPHLTAHKPYAFCVLAIKNNVSSKRI
ncbi:fibronectin type III domain protein [Cooperia oncophora]